MNHLKIQLLLCVTIILACLPSSAQSHKIAVIGGGISGTFTSKYLVDYDAKGCQLESITIYDPNPIGEETPKNATLLLDDDSDWQGSRVAAMRLDDGRVLELGASVFHEANQLLKEMIHNDPSLEIGEPFNVGRDGPQPIGGTTTAARTRDGLGIYNGGGNWKFMSNKTAPWNTFWTLMRYNMDLYRVDRWTTRAQDRFSTIPGLLESNQANTFFESPDDMWEYVNLLNPVHASFDQLLDAIGVSKNNYWLNKVLPYQGSVRAELLTAINLINYNQGNDQVNGLVGLVSFAASKGPLYSVVGGNHQIIKSAFQQAQANAEKNCQKKDLVVHKQQKITSVIGSLDGFELFSGKELVGTYDSVILAAPLQQSRIQFMIPSHVDPAVLQPMPLADGMVDADAVSIEDHEGHPVLPGKLPRCATKPYTQVATTVVSNAFLRHDYFQILEEKLPRSVCMTEVGKLQESNITVVSQIAGDGVYKIFSSDVLDSETLDDLFGPSHTVEYVKLWGGQHGGATPDYGGGGATVGYLLYDGATGFEGHTQKGGLFYPNAIESALACMEASAVGAKSVAKLVARRFKMVIPDLDTSHDGDEL